jgi:hypothetical protein
MDISNAALTIYVSTEVVNLAGVIIDYVLIKDGLPSITEVSTKYPIIGTCLILFQIVSPVSLGVHLWYYNKNSDSMV